MQVLDATTLYSPQHGHDLLIASMDMQDCFAIRGASELGTEYLDDLDGGADSRGWHYVDRRTLDDMAEVANEEDWRMAWSQEIITPQGATA